MKKLLTIIIILFSVQGFSQTTKIFNTLFNDGKTFGKRDTETVTSLTLLAKQGLNSFGAFYYLNTDSIGVEGSTNLWFTNARARSAISLTTTGSSGAATYNSSTGVLNVPQYAAGVGTVTDFSAGDISGFATTSEATTTSTPALTFGLTNTSQYTVWGRKASGSGAPSYLTTDSSLIPDLHSQGYYDLRYAATGGGGGTPAGSTGWVQYNNAGAFGADSLNNWDNTNKKLMVGGTVPNGGISRSWIGRVNIKAPADTAMASFWSTNGYPLARFYTPGGDTLAFNTRNVPFVFKTNFNADGFQYTSMYFDPAGYVMIGGTPTGVAMSAPLTVKGLNKGIGIRAIADNSDRWITFVGNGSGGFSIGEAYTQLPNTLWHIMSGNPATTEVMTITNGSRIGFLQATPTSSFHFNSSEAHAYVAKAVDYTATISENTIELTATGKTITLPTAIGCTGRVYTIKLTASGTGTVATTSSQTIDGSTTYSLSAQYKYVTVMSNNANWIITANN